MAADLYSLIFGNQGALGNLLNLAKGTPNGQPAPQQGMPPQTMPQTMPQPAPASAPQDQGLASLIGARNEYPAAPLPMNPAMSDNFARPQPSTGGFLDGLKGFARNNALGDRIHDFALGLSQGETPSDSFAYGAQTLAAGNKGRRNSNQTVDFLKSRGFSENDARAIAQDPQMVRTILTSQQNSTDPLNQFKAAQIAAGIGKTEAETEKIRRENQGPGSEYGKVGEGRRWVRNADGNWSQELIPGSKAGDSVEEAKNIKNADMEARAEQAQYGLKTVARLRERYPSEVWTGTAFRSVGDFLLPHSAIEIDADINSLQSIIAGDMLKAAKAASKNGASGFGNLSNREYIGLAERIRGLRYGMSRGAFKDALDDIEGYFKKAASPRKEPFAAPAEQEDSENSTVPQGLTAEQWEEMTPEERALWN